MPQAQAPAQYDAIAAAYQRTKESPLRRYVEAWTIFELLGDLRGRRVLDLGCGDGHYARRIAAAGAAEVVGVDVSAAMLDLARARESAGPRIAYVQADAADLPGLGRFDLVLGAYLLHYAPDVATLGRICRGIAGCLAPGGRFVGLNENPDQGPGRDYEQYGFSKRMPEVRADGAPVRYWMASGRELVELTVHYYSRPTYEAALSAAGFGAVRWSRPRLDPAGLEALGASYWEAYLADPPVLALECHA